MTDERRRRMPVWVPNPLDGMVLFLLEAAIVVALAVIAVVVAALAHWAF